MAAFLPILFFLLTLTAFVRRPQPDLRKSFLNAAVVWGLVVAGLTEGLSLFSLLTATAVKISWAVAVLTAAGLALRSWRSRERASWPRWAWLPLLEIVLCALIGGILAVTAAIALMAPPNNWDAMTYHLPRVAHWMQDRDLAFYPTPFHPQLHNPPWAEYAILHLMLLTGGDRLANLVQWFSMAGSVLIVSRIAGQLGAERRGQVAASFFCATLPMSILQATSTQNDYVAAFWLVGLVSFTLDVRSRPTPGNVLGAGASLGLALLTKGTSYVFAAPLLLVTVHEVAAASRAAAVAPADGRRTGRCGCRSARGSYLSHRLLELLAVRWRPPARRLAAVAGCVAAVLLVALCLNAPHYARTYRLYGHVLVDRESPNPGQWEYKNQTYSVNALTSNLSRNLALQLVSPWDAGNRLVEHVVREIHRRRAIDINDPRTTWTGTRFEYPPYGRFTHHEDLAGNLPHLLLLGVMAVGAGIASVVALCRGRPALGKAGGLGAAVALAFVLFCLMLRWQPWHCRLHLPLFVLAAPVAGVVLGRRRPAVLFVAAVLLAGWAAPYLVYNERRPLLGEGDVRTTPRRTQYFRASPELEASHVGAAAFLRDRGQREVGLVAAPDEWEYPLWVLLTHFDPRACRLEHLAYDDIAARAAAGRHAAFRPGAIVVSAGGTPPAEIEVRGRVYRIAWWMHPLTVYLAADSE